MFVLKGVFRMKIRKTFAAAVIAALLLNLFGTGVFAADETLSANVFMTVANGELLLAQEPVEVTDYNSDGKLTLDDAFYAAHEQYYEGGAAAGYAASGGAWLTKLWGIANGGNFGYYVNNKSSMGLTDEIKEGDYIAAFAYTDPYWADEYGFFDKNTVYVSKDREFTLTLSSLGWGPDASPVEGAEITVDGVKTGVKTDENGSASLKLDITENAVISAVSEDMVLVPPVCIAKPAKTAEVYVTIANGDLKIAAEPVIAADIDNDGEVTVNDALYAAHEQYYEGGAEAGYGTEYGQYGLSITKLWGAENGSGFGYYVNNVSAYSLTDKMEDGDYLTAFVYTDTINYSDTYCYFDKNTVSAKAGEEVTLTLSAAGYDDRWNPITVSVENAEITVNGVKTGLKTDKDGKVTLKLDTAGALVISAVSEDTVLVPPVCKVSVSAAETDSGNNNTGSGEKDDTPKSPVTGENNTAASVAVLSAAMLAVICLAVITLKKSYEK